MKMMAGEAPVEDLHRGELDHAVPHAYFETSGLGIEDDLAHQDLAVSVMFTSSPLHMFIASRLTLLARSPCSPTRRRVRSRCDRHGLSPNAIRSHAGPRAVRGAATGRHSSPVSC